MDLWSSLWAVVTFSFFAGRDGGGHRNVQSVLQARSPRKPFLRRRRLPGGGSVSNPGGGVGGRSGPQVLVHVSIDQGAIWGNYF